MEYKEILEEARKQTAPHCMACPVCNGKACGNNVPGPGSKAPGNAAARNYDKWQEIFVNMDTLCQSVVDPDISFELFGRRFSAPLFVAPLGAVDMHYGKKYTDDTYNAEMMRGAIDCGILAFTGDGVNPQIMKDAIAESGALGGLSIPTIKPWAKEVVFEKLDDLNAHGVFAAAMDVDAAGLPFLQKQGGKAGSKTVEEMREIIEHAGKPFIVKGIMTVAGAKKAVEAGAAGIVVSNHGGRVQGGVPSTAEVLGVTRNLRTAGEKTAYYIVCRYRDPVTGKEETYSSRALDEYPGKEVIGRQVTVRLDAREKGKYTVEIDPLLEAIRLDSFRNHIKQPRDRSGPGVVSYTIGFQRRISSMMASTSRAAPSRFSALVCS